MIKAHERGRSLVLTVGDGDDALEVVVRPVPGKIGSAMLAQWCGVLFGQSSQPEEDATDFSMAAIGEENWALVTDELRFAEAEQVINAALFWQMQGGSIALVNEYLAEGLPKARLSLLQAVGLGDAFSQLQTLLNTASASPTPSPAATPDTSTRPSSAPSGAPTPPSGSASKTVDRLPPTKRSIGQASRP